MSYLRVIWVRVGIGIGVHVELKIHTMQNEWGSKSILQGQYKQRELAAHLPVKS